MIAHRALAQGEEASMRWGNRGKGAARGKKRGRVTAHSFKDKI